MHTTIDYSKSPTPQFDAMRDVMDYLGADRYAEIAPKMAKVVDCEIFAVYCELAGIKGFPVRAWYEHFHGQGSWKQEQFDAIWG